MFVLLPLLAIIFSLLLVVGIHEAGHAVAARLFNIKIIKISIGFGKALLSWRGRSGCQWIWALWPAGGYVQLLNSRIAPVAESDAQYSFDKKTVWVRCIVLFSGAIANVLTAWLALMLMLMIGYQQMTPVIGQLIVPSIAANAGLAQGDQVVSINGHAVSSWSDVGMQLVVALGLKKVDVVAENTSKVRHEVTLDLSQLRFNRHQSSLLTAIGIQPDPSIKYKYNVAGLPWLAALAQASVFMTHVLYFFMVVLKQLFLGVIPFGLLLGPIGLFAMMVDSFIHGLAVFLNFVASLSLAVAFINLLPIPGLDGGSILYALIEKIRGKPISVGMEILLHRLVFIAFCLILVQLLLNDVHRYLH